jgi:2-oxoglutarate ferredoxin oxidoreductase subunit beta
MGEVTKLIHKYLRHDKKFPHVWCPGCGNFAIEHTVKNVLAEMEMGGRSLDEIVLVTGIGCHQRSPII